MFKLSDAQRNALNHLKRHGIGCDYNSAEPHWSYMPPMAIHRTYKALEDRGLVRFRHYDPLNGVQYAGYVITEAMANL